jgi:hypothetical protein
VALVLLAVRHWVEATGQSEGEIEMQPVKESLMVMAQAYWMEWLVLVVEKNQSEESAAAETALPWALEAVELLVAGRSP